MKPYSIAIAGSTEHTLLCAEILEKSPEFTIPWTLTPTPKLIGREHVLTENPFHQWCQKKEIPTLLVSQKIDVTVQAAIENEIGSHGRPDFLLVVDFGYLVPNWLLALPTIAPLNIHPSLLPRWRGSSPGQFTLLYGDRNSAVTLMQMNSGLDTGPLIYQEKFKVDSAWTQTDYYQTAFEIMGKILTEKIIEFAKTGVKTDQPTILPTPVARRLKKEDGYIPWPTVISAMHDTEEDSGQQLTLLEEVVDSMSQKWSVVIEHASRAFSPWPTLWTILPTNKGDKRMQIIKCHVNPDKTLVLEQVKIEGQDVKNWSEVKNQILEK